MQHENGSRASEGLLGKLDDETIDRLADLRADLACEHPGQRAYGKDDAKRGVLPQARTCRYCGAPGWVQVRDEEAKRAARMAKTKRKAKRKRQIEARLRVRLDEKIGRVPRPDDNEAA